MVEDFFLNLSQRFSSENDLSDVTWAMTQTSDKFLTEFLRFFFPKVRFGVIDLEREHAEGENRPDFYFLHKGDVYLIECKIWDRLQHFEQYTKAFHIPPERLGYITNYPLEKEGFSVKTWTELYLFLKKRIPKEEEQLWKGYLKYLKNVCNIFIPMKPMNTEGMYSLYEFYHCLDQVFSNDNDIFTSQPYEKNNSQETKFGGNRIHNYPNNGLMGKYFQVDFKGRKKIDTTRGWMGVYFWTENPTICIGFSDKEDWGLPVYKRLQTKLNTISDGKLSSAPYDEYEGVIWFDFTANNRFNKLTKPNSQIKLLKSFFVEVMGTIANI